MLGGLQWLSTTLFQFAGPGMAYQISLLVAFAVISGVIELPFDYYKQFVLEQKFGFNKMTRRLFITDLVKGALLGAAIGLPLIWVVLTLMEKSGDLWWLYAWLVWSGFQLLMLVLYPTVIAPLFNKFAPMPDRTSSSQVAASSSSICFAYMSSLARIFFAFTNICFSPVERPFS